MLNSDRKLATDHSIINLRRTSTAHYRDIMNGDKMCTYAAAVFPPTLFTGAAAAGAATATRARTASFGNCIVSEMLEMLEMLEMQREMQEMLEMLEMLKMKMLEMLKIEMLKMKMLKMLEMLMNGWKRGGSCSYLSAFLKDFSEVLF
jgi:hypothetical protein